MILEIATIKMQTDDLKAAHDHLYNEKLAAEKSNKNLQISVSEINKKLSDGNLQLQDADSFNKKSANENGKFYFISQSNSLNREDRFTLEECGESGEGASVNANRILRNWGCNKARRPQAGGPYCTPNFEK